MKDTLMKLVGIRNEEKKKKPQTAMACDLNSTFVDRKSTRLNSSH